MQTIGIVEVTCPCGQVFQTTEKRIEQGRGRYHSKRCMYQFRVRPRGLTYNIVQVNKGWANVANPPKGPDSPQWKGDHVGYRELHRWVAANKGRPANCEWCGRECRTQWANLSHAYQRDLDDWAALCGACHGSHDAGEAWGSATRKYGALAVQEGH